MSDLREIGVLSPIHWPLLGVQFGDLTPTTASTTTQIEGGFRVRWTATLDGREFPAEVEDENPCRAYSAARRASMSELLATLDEPRVAELARLGYAPRWRQLRS